MAEEKKTSELRELATMLREFADATDKLAEVDEREDATEEEQEAALKDYTWAAMKFQAYGSKLG